MYCVKDIYHTRAKDPESIYCYYFIPLPWVWRYLQPLFHPPKRTHCSLWQSPKLFYISHIGNQLEKLEAAKAAGLVCLSLLSLPGSFLVNFYWPYWALLGLTGPYLALFSITLHLRTNWLTNERTFWATFAAKNNFLVIVYSVPGVSNVKYIHYFNN